jgi:tetratricopeptide (TPR) repeat protein
MAAWGRHLSGKREDILSALNATHDFSQQIEDSWGEAESAWRLAGAHLEIGNYGHALELALRAADLARTVGQPTMLELALATLGSVQRKIMALSPAQQTLEAALGEISESSPPGYVDWPLGELCAVKAMTGNWDEAFALARKALGVRNERGLPPIGLTGWYETEALLRGGARDQVKAELERQEALGGANKRMQMSRLSSLALLAEWDGEHDLAGTYWNAAADLSRQMGLTGEEWVILGRLADAYDMQRDAEKAQRAQEAAAEILLRLVHTIDDEELRQGFLSAQAVRSILESSRGSTD